MRIGVRLKVAPRRLRLTKLPLYHPALAACRQMMCTLYGDLHYALLKKIVHNPFVSAGGVELLWRLAVLGQ